MLDRLQVGVITNTHGISGEVKVFPTTDDIGRFKKLKEVICDGGKGERTLTVTSAKLGGKLVILKFKEFDNINQVECLKGAKLYVTRENAVKTEKDEYFIADLIGLSVVSTEGEKLGILKDVMETGANDVYVVETPDGGELLLPAIKECIRSVDLAAGVVTAYLMPGLK